MASGAVVERLRTRRGVARWEAVACGGVCDVEIDAEDEISIVPRVGGNSSSGTETGSSSESDSEDDDADGDADRGGGRWRIKEVVRVTPPEESSAARDPACPDPPLTLSSGGVSWRLHFCQAGDAAAWTAWATAAAARRDWRAAATAAIERLAPALANLGVQLAVHADLDRTPATTTTTATAVVGVQAYPTPTAHGAITATAPSWADVCQGVRVLQRVLALYTPAVLRASGVRTVALVRTLTFAGARRQAVPDLATGTLHVALEAAAVDARYLRRMVHHELFHFLDYACSPEGLYTDTAWTALNAPGVQYAGGPLGAGARHQHQPVVHAWDAAVAVTSADRPLPPGIVSSYCLTGVEEDKAELFAYRMCHPRRLARLCAADAVLARKCAALAAFVDGLNGGPAFFPAAAAPRRPPATNGSLAHGAAPAPADTTYYGSLLVLSASASDW